MPSPLLPLNLQSLSDVSASDAQRLIAAAQAIRRAGASAQRLRGRHLAVLCEAPHSASADAFAAAALALGAAVVRLQPSSLRLNGRRAGRDTARDTARALGRLYGAIGCDGLAPAGLGVLARWAGVPVFDAVADLTHPLWRLAEQWAALDIAAGALASAPDEIGPGRIAPGHIAPPFASPFASPVQPMSPVPTTPPAQRLANHAHLLQAWLSDCIT